jgi:hypothetical protein
MQRSLSFDVTRFIDDQGWRGEPGKLGSGSISAIGPAACRAFSGEMNRVKIVRSAFQAVRVRIVGSTRSIHGVSQSPPLEKMFCISMQRWTAFEIGSISVLTGLMCPPRSTVRLGLGVVNPFRRLGSPLVKFYVTQMGVHRPLEKKPDTGGRMPGHFRGLVMALNVHRREVFLSRAVR